MTTEFMKLQDEFDKAIARAEKLEAWGMWKQSETAWEKVEVLRQQIIKKMELKVVVQ